MKEPEVVRFQGAHCSCWWSIFLEYFQRPFFLKLAQKALKIDPMPKLLLQLHMHFSCSSTCFEGRIWEYWCCICTFAVQFVPQNSWDDTLLRPCCYLAGREEDATRWNQSLIDHARTHILDIPWSLELSKKTREKGYNNISKPSSFKLEHPRICIYNIYILYIIALPWHIFCYTSPRDLGHLSWTHPHWIAKFWTVHGLQKCHLPLRRMKIDTKIGPTMRLLIR